MNKYTPQKNEFSTIEYVPLPKVDCQPEGLGIDACPWLDEYISFSRKWSPRSYYGYHEAVGLWILSTIAARRVMYHFGKPRYTNLMIALVGRTTITAKSSAAEIGKAVLNATGLSSLLLPDTITPQKMLNEMSSHLPDNYQGLTIAQKEEAELRLAFIGQRGWYYDEFGSMIAGMMRQDGVMADFRSHLRRFDDSPEKFENATISRGNEVINRPYLALLASMTPVDLSPYARSGSSLWRDGFLARIVLITPDDFFQNNGRFPKGPRIIPASIITPLRNWHEALGIPKIRIVDSKIEPSMIPVKEIEMTEEVTDSYYSYSLALEEILKTLGNYDLDGNYGRFPERALRIAALFSSFSNSSRINMNHWARAQEIVERWRMNLHTLYRQLNDQQGDKKSSNEDRVLRIIDRMTNPTAREIQQETGLKSVEVQIELDKLVDNNTIGQTPCGKTIRYQRTPKKPL